MMNGVPWPLEFLWFCVTGWINQQQQVIEAPEEARQQEVRPTVHPHQSANTR